MGGCREQRVQVGVIVNEDAAESLVVDVWPDTYQQEKDTAYDAAERRMRQQERDASRSGWSHPPKGHRR
jgi:hypothetical protein